MAAVSTQEYKAGSQDKATSDADDHEVFKLAPFNPSSEQIQEKSIELLNLTEKDVLFDLGCGDGRFLINAAKRIPGLRCVGVEMDKMFVSRAHSVIEKLPDNTRCRIDIREGDVLKIPMTPSFGNEKAGAFPTSSITMQNVCRNLKLMDDATVLYLFILPKGVKKIMDMLEALKRHREKEGRDLRILSYMFKIESWEPTKVDRTSKAGCPIYLYEFKPRPSAETSNQKVI